MTKRILLLLPTTTYRAHDFIEAGLRLDVETVVGTDQKQLLEDATPGTTVALAFENPILAADQIEAFARRRPVDAIVPTDETTVEVAAVAARRLGLNHNPPEAARAARYKDMLRQKLRDAGVRTPRFNIVPSTESPAEAARRQTYPCVLKPTFLAASRGVIRADDRYEFEAALERIRALLATPEVMGKGGAAVDHVLVEEFVPGGEVALEGLLIGGKLKTLALFDKPDALDGPFFEETIYVTPSQLSAKVQGRICDVAAEGCRALGLIEGPVHAELRLNEQGAWLIEVAARSIGGLCSRTLKFGAAISLEELILRHARGDLVESFERDREPAGVMMLPVPHAGILRAVGGLEEARRVPGIVDVTMTIPVGQPVVPLPEGSKYLGFIFARGVAPDFVDHALREAHARLRIEIDQELTPSRAA